MSDIFSTNVKSGDLLRAEPYQNMLTFLKGSSVAGGSVSAYGLNVPSEETRSPRIVRFIADEEIKTFSIIELTEQVEDDKNVDNHVPTFKARPANGDSGTLFYTEFSFTEGDGTGIAYSIGGEPILIRSEATSDGTPGNGEIVAADGGAFRYLGESDVPELKWFLPVQGGGIAGEPAPGKVRLVQPKELFPACEYKTLQDVYGCTLEYSDTGNDDDWVESYWFHIIGGRVVHTFPSPDAALKAHQYWRLNLKGFALPEDPNDPHADRGFYTFGRLWEALFYVEREAETKRTITRQMNKDETEKTEYTFTADVPDDWLVNQKEPLSVDISLSPAISEGELFYRPNTGDWKSLGTFTESRQVMIPAEDLQILVDSIQTDDSTETNNTSFMFRVEQTVEEYNTATDTTETVKKEVGSLTLYKPTYTLSPDDADLALHNPVGLKTFPPPSADPNDFSQDFEVAAGYEEGSFVKNVDVTAGHTYWDSKPTPRKAQNHRYWMLTFDQPEVVTKVTVDVDQHLEHYIICPGGRDAFKQDVPFIYSFDLAAEKWTAATFPELQKPMFNMDAKVVELADKTHQLIVLSGQVANGFSNIIQGYNFERDYIQNVVDTGTGGLNFAGRPALSGDPMLRNGFVVNRPDGEWDFSRSLIVVGGSERSCFIRGSTSAIDSVLFSIQGSTLAIRMPYETQTLNISLSNTGHTGLPFGFFDYRTYASQAGAVGNRLQNMGTYTRHQNLPVRGILRRRPLGNTSQPSSSNPVIDFLLIGGFNQVGREAYNSKIVSGIFNSPTANAANSGQYSMLIQNPHFSANNAYNLLYYPDCEKVLGDCCAEYVNSNNRDEVICFGGRTNENDTALAHDTPAVLVFDPNTNAAAWEYEKYPRMPHPRWSAASVLIKDFVRNGETEPCDRIFIIGGRNREGFVAEVDVFNLNRNEWETEENGYKHWKGLDQGELENYTPSGGGTTIIIQGGGGDGIQSVKAGEGISVSGDRRNPTLSVNVQEIVDRIIQDEAFKTEIAHKITESSNFRDLVASTIMNHSGFQQIITESLLSNSEFKQSIVDAVIQSSEMIGSIAVALAYNPAFLNNVTQTILGNQAFVNQVVDAVINNVSLVSQIVHHMSEDETFISTILERLTSNSAFVETIVNLMLESADFQNNIAQKIINSQAFVGVVKNSIIADANFKKEIIENILSNADFKQEVILALTQSSSLIQSLSDTILSNSTFITGIANEILHNETVLNQIIHDVVNNDFLIGNIVESIIEHPKLLASITNEIVSNEILIGDIINQVVNNQSLYEQIIASVLTSQTFVNSVTNQIVSNDTIVNKITQEVTTNQDLFQYITHNVSTSSVFVKSVTEQIISNQAVIHHITNEVMQSETLIQNIANTILTSETVINVLSGAISLVAPDGSSVATNDGGKMTLQAATNSQFGIIKGQSNTSPTTWHHVSATGGALSINREQIEAVMDSKDLALRRTVNVRAEDGSIVGRNVDGIIILPFRYVETEPTSPAEGTLYLIKEADAATP